MMEADSRFPNRKIPAVDKSGLGQQDAESDSKKPYDDLEKAGLQDLSGEKKEEAQLPLNTYKIIESEPEAPSENPAVKEEPTPIDVSTEAEEKKATNTPPIPRPPFYAPWIERIRKYSQEPTKVYATAGVCLGILVGVVIATYLWHWENPEGPYDLGSSTSSAVGLRGHLFTKWDKKLQYRITIEPTEQEQQEGFALAVANSPRPLSIAIHLQDAKGFVLCSKEILLKFDARNAAALAAPTPDSQANKTEAGAIFNEQLEQGIDLARLEAQEPARELGKDIFQNQFGKDGQTAAIFAQGEIPCSAKAYENTFSWSFSSDFPSVAEQDELLKRKEETKANAARLVAAPLAAPKKRMPKPAQKLLPFALEGDDAIVELDASRGFIETSGRKIFFFDKTGGQGADSKWQEYPVSIHYKCDRISNCTLTHSGLGALHAKLKK
jgi:hypothetical protein